MGVMHVHIISHTDYQLVASAPGDLRRYLIHHKVERIVDYRTSVLDSIKQRCFHHGTPIDRSRPAIGVILVNRFVLLHFPKVGYDSPTSCKRVRV